MGVDAGADRRAARWQFEDRRQCSFRSLYRQFQLPDVTTEFLPEPDRRGVGQVGATDLDDAVPLLGLLIERIAELLQGRN